MKTSTAFACQIPLNDYDLHLFINSLIEKDPQFIEEYGLQKVFSIKLQDYIGFAGAIRSKNKLPNLDNISVEVVRYLKKKYIGNGYGNIIDNHLSQKLEERENILVGTICENHHTSNYLAIKYGMIFKGKMTKIYKCNQIVVNTYVRYPAKLKNIDFNVKDFLSMIEIS
jgi:hypothetical protein